MAEKSAARSGIEITPAQKRGATTRAIGSTAIISIAASCSVAFMRPISAVIAEPARLANSSPATSAPDSPPQANATTRPRNSEALQGEQHADEQTRDQDYDQRQHAREVDLGDRQVKAPQSRARMHDQVGEE